jgi:chromosome segregation ATPase
MMIMKRVFIALCVATLLPFAAQSQTTPAKPAKPVAKKAADPVEPPKPKQRLLSIDQLRRCMKLNAENNIEGAALRIEKAEVEAERAKLVEERTALQQLSETLQVEAKGILAEQAELQDTAKEFAKPVEKADLKEVEAKRVAYNARIDSNKKRVEAFNASRVVLNSTKARLDPLIEPSNIRLKKLQDRVDEHNYGLEDWKADCADRPYAEADEAIIKKEMAK